MDYSKEKFEAIQAGERALNALYEASIQISGAKGLKEMNCQVVKRSSTGTDLKISTIVLVETT